MGSRSTPILHSVRQLTLAQLEDRFAPLLPPSLLPQNPTGDYSRERIFTLARTFFCWLWQILQANTSCREVVRQVQALFALQAAGPIDEATGAYCQARCKLPLPLLESLFALTSQAIQTSAPALAQTLLQGRPVRVADGSGTRLPDTPKNRHDYPPSKNLRAHTGLPFLRIVGLLCLASGVLLAQATGSLHAGELRLFVSLLSHLQPKDILLGDRAYGSYIVIVLLQAIGVDLIARVPTGSRRVDFRKAKQRLALQDALFVWDKPSKASPLVSLQQWLGLPAQVEVRILRVRLQRRGFRTQQLTLVTTLLDAQLYPAEQIIMVHARRWRMELCLRDLKATLSMGRLSCQSPQMAKKELLMFLIAHNLLRWLIVQAAQHGNVELERISFKGSLDAFRQWTQAMAMRRGPRNHRRRAQLWEELLRTLVADALPDRPGRVEPRTVRTRSKYPYMNRPRHQYVGRMSRNDRRVIANAKKNAALN